MNIYAEIAASWVALDVVLIVAWHAAHVILRAPRTRSAQARPAQARPTHARTHTAPAHLSLINAG